MDSLTYKLTKAQ